MIYDEDVFWCSDIRYPTSCSLQDNILAAHIIGPHGVSFAYQVTNLSQNF